MPKVEIGRIPGTGNVFLDQEQETLQVSTYPTVRIFPPEVLSTDEHGDPQLSYGDPLFDGKAAVRFRNEVEEETEDQGRRPTWEVEIDFPWTGTRFPNRAVAEIELHDGPLEIYRITESYANGVRAILRGVRG